MACQGNFKLERSGFVLENVCLKISEIIQV